MVVISVLLLSVLALVGVLLLWSPGRPTPFLDDNGKPFPGSISEKIHVNINGVEQGMFIKGKDSSNPVLLYLHGACLTTSLQSATPPVSTSTSP